MFKEYAYSAVDKDITLDLSSFDTSACTVVDDYVSMLDSMKGVKHIIIGDK